MFSALPLDALDDEVVTAAHEAQEQFPHRPSRNRPSGAADLLSLPVSRRPSSDTPIPAYFGIHEADDDLWVRLRLTGELDLGSVPVLRHHLARLSTEKRPVRLDLSGLEFMDSSGVHLLIGAFNDARENGWQLVIDSALAPQVKRIIQLSGLDRIIPGLQQERVAARVRD